MIFSIKADSITASCVLENYISFTPDFITETIPVALVPLGATWGPKRDQQTHLLN